ncbi:dihydrolipoyl dehydrogenase family protein [Autumnicola musiva]|uniref:NAD(P)/FAD-dependent oxidoreductase n=1 Tax=Autumnicola musiva TaxID=3075589 RepID=A0ABU3D4U8_9FLAO|nr:NAD(P)/FAD-dependent oxidoreductase [Zunongwangia sp. F117]MDT0676560.1 NAD(P)/FAD-dependent oxidoreductase [Zunongwangia sp. F117]
MNRKQFDLIVIGSGSGGLGIALGMLEFGFKVLLVDKSAEKIGGECLNTGCIPSKSFLHAAKIVQEARKAREFGLEINGKTDFLKILEYVKQKQEVIREHENAGYLRKQGLHVILGTAKFISEKTVEVNGKEYSAKNIVVATGSSPRKINIKGLEFTDCYTNENIFEISSQPENFIFIGAGSISIELAQAFSRLGSKVIIVDRGERILKKEDPFISNVLQQKLEAEDIRFILNAEIEEILSSSVAVIKTAEGEKIEIPIDAIFMGLGRELNFDNLNLKAAGIEMDGNRIKLNEKLQTTNKNVFVSGDAAGNMKFSHAAEMNNMLLLNNFLSPLKKKLDFSHFSWVTFTDPEVATFGWNKEQLKEKGISYERLESDFSESDRAVTAGFEDAKILLFIEKKKYNSGAAKILGGSILAPGAGEIFQELVLANSAGISIKQLMDKIYPYPTAANMHKILFRNRILKDLKQWMKKFVREFYKF